MIRPESPRIVAKLPPKTMALITSGSGGRAGPARADRLHRPLVLLQLPLVRPPHPSRFFAPRTRNGSFAPPPNGRLHPGRFLCFPCTHAFLILVHLLCIPMRPGRFKHARPPAPPAPPLAHPFVHCCASLCAPDGVIRSTQAAYRFGVRFRAGWLHRVP